MTVVCTGKSTVLKINTKEPAYKADVLESVAEWLGPDVQADQYIVQGPDVAAAKRFSVKFTGSAVIAAARARKGIGLLKDAEGKWANRFTKRAGGAQLDNQMYISFDKSPKMEQMEALSKKLIQICKHVCPDRQLYLVRRGGSVCEQGEHFARVIPKYQAESIVEFNRKKTIADDDKKKIDDLFRKQIEKPAAQWHSI